MRNKCIKDRNSGKKKYRFLLTMVFSLEKLSLPAFLLGSLNLEQISVHEIAHVILVKGVSVLIDSLLEEIRHFRPILRDLVSDALHARQVTHDRYIVDGYHAGEEFESLLDEAHEFFELRVAVMETHSHYERADHVTDRHTETERDVCGRPASHRHPPQKRINFALNQNIAIIYFEF